MGRIPVRSKQMTLCIEENNYCCIRTNNPEFLENGQKMKLLANPKNRCTGPQQVLANKLP